MLFILLLLFISFFNAYSNVIGIDFGSDTMKVAIVQPGAPLEVVTNFQSKRKTPLSITFYRGERMFGSDSLVLAARKPELTFGRINRLIGRNIDHPTVQELVNHFKLPYEVYSNETTKHTTLKQVDTYYTPEELLAMLMEYAKDMTKNYGGKAIKDCVITVPSTFTQHERLALYAAADIADLRVLSLIEENTAAALHYGIDRVFEEPSTVLYYNLGANSLQVSIVTYSSYVVKEAGKNKTIGQFEVVGKGTDGHLGGFEYDLVIANMLADKFNEIWANKKKDSGDIRDVMRPMARLRNEAKKIKEVLSANSEFPFKVEQLHADLDISTKVTRADFEAASKDLTNRLTLPIEKALDMANLTLADINAVELLGGSVRMPQVKKKLEEYFGEAKLELGQHMNGDEAMALGAAFRAANLSTAFRVRKVGSSDMSTFGVRVKLENLPKDQSKGGIFGLFNGKKDDDTKSDWEKQTSVFSVKSPVPSKTKTLAFNHDSDILCRIEYETQDKDVPPLLGVFNITGISEFAQDTVAKGLGVPKVHLSFSLDSSGVVTLSKAEATVELPVEPEPEPEVEEEAEAAADASTSDSTADAETATETSTETKTEDETSTETEDTATEKEEGKKDESADSTSTDADAKDEEESKDGESKEDSEKASKEKEEKDKKDKKEKKEKKDKKKKKKETKQKKDNMLRKTLEVADNPELISPVLWTPSKIAEARGRLKALAAADELRRNKEAANNELEAFIYSVRGKFVDDEEALATVSTEEQRTAVVEMANELEEWLYDDGRNADLADYKAKHLGLKEISNPILERLHEKDARPKAVEDVRATIVKLEGKIEAWNDTMPHITEEEKEKINAMIEDVKVWIDGKLEEQEKLEAHEDPAFKSTQVELQLKPVLSMYQKLYKKPKPKPKTKPANETTSANETDSNSSNSTEPETVKVEVNTEDSEDNSNEGEEKSDGEEKETSDTTEEGEGESGTTTKSEEEL